MAEITKVNGNTHVGEQIGRDVIFVGVTVANAVLDDAVNGGSETYLDKVRQVIDSASSITIVGVNSTTLVTFMCEGLGFGGPGSGAETFGEVGAGTIGLQAQADAIDAALVAVDGGALGAVVVTLGHIEDLGIATDVTSA